MKRILISMTAASALLLSACSQEEAPKNNADSQEEPNKNTEKGKGEETAVSEQPATGEIVHIHGAGYPGNDEGLYVATHHGLKIYRDGNWYELTANNHDYMGFQAVKDGFYSSGHPEQGSDLKNPLGLVKSSDKGKSLDMLAFYGESDFHYLTVGYESKAIYAVNQHENPKMGTGLYYSLDEGKTWEKAALRNLPQTVAGQLIAHPANEKIVGVATDEGVYLSNDNGNEFNPITDKLKVTALSIQKDYILYSTTGEQGAELVKQNLNSQSKEAVKLPDLADDNIIAYININPKNESEISLITSKNDIFLTQDAGQTWKAIVEEGKFVQP